jgi:integrase
MSVYKRKDSKFWWMYLELTKTSESTSIPIGETIAQRKDSLAVATEMYQQRMLALAKHVHRLPKALELIRFGPYAEAYAAHTIATRRGARREREMLIPLRRHFDAVLLTAMDVEAVKGYTTARLAAGIGPRTINREVDLLKGMLRDAVPKYLESSPLVGMKRLRVPPVRRRLLTADEERRLLAVCEDAQDRAMIIVTIDTMTRQGNILEIARTDREGPWIYIKDSKNGSAYRTALTPRAQAALDAIDHDRPYYFAKFRRAENSRDWGSSMRQRLEYLCRKAKVPYGQRHGGVTFHWATRRTGATRYLVEQQQPLAVVQKQGNWKHPEILLQVYAEVGQDDQLRMVGALPRLRKKKVS